MYISIFKKVVFYKSIPDAEYSLLTSLNIVF